MKKMKLSILMVPAAVLGFVLRLLVYRMAVDGKNLIVKGHPVLAALWLVTAAALALAAFVSWKQKDGKLAEESNPAAFLGHGMLGVSVAMTVLLNDLPMVGSLPKVEALGMAWKILGMVSPLCLLAAGFERLRGKAPFFALYAGPALFFVAHVVVHYQVWCAIPQFTDYAFALLASVMLALHSYQLAASELGEGKRQVLVFTALAAVYLCGTELVGSLYPYLYLGGALFCATNLWE